MIGLHDHDLTQALSFVGGVIAAILSFLVVRFYIRGVLASLRATGGMTATAWFSLGIVVAFTGTGLNALQWSVVYRAAVILEAQTVLYVLIAYGPYTDFLFKGVMTSVGAYLHLYAGWLVLPDDHRQRWHPLTMPFYPNMRALYIRVFRASVDTCK